MSVHGEFLRVLEECIALLEQEGEASPERRALHEALGGAREQRKTDLDGAARKVIEALDGERAPGAAAHGGDAALRERCEHLLAICRIVVGAAP